MVPITVILAAEIGSVALEIQSGADPATFPDFTNGKLLDSDPDLP
jgi:FlaG/FlaF family flagellin (archaellin)